MLPRGDTRTKKVYTQRRGASQAASKRNSHPDEGKIGFFKGEV